MNLRGHTSALLALGMTLALAVPAHAQYGRVDGSNGTSATLRVNFGTALHWTSISGTRVEEIPSGERPDYDMFRYNGSYYVYDNDRWYMSPRERGDFVAIDARSVPGEFSSIPRDHWRNYPAEWQDRRDQAPADTYGSLQVDLGNSPRWTSIRGTRVREIRQGERPDYDVFAYGDSYYAYHNNLWYSSRTRTGQFTRIDDRYVPREFANIPRNHWRNYPSQWQSQRNSGPGGMRAMLQVNLGRTPRWSAIHGTRVREIRGGNRPNYDMFGYGGNYYVYSNNRWYSSRSPNGSFVEIDERSVPGAFTDIPRDHWRNYPSGWQDENRNQR